MTPKRYTGYVLARLVLVLSSLSPIFIIWAIQGADLIRDLYFIPICIVLVVLPNAFIAYRIWYVQKNGAPESISIGNTDDHRMHLLFYLFVILIPFYGIHFSSWRSIVAAIAVLTFLVFIFWHINLHYINIGLEVFGYHVYTVDLADGTDRLVEGKHYVLITKRDQFEGATEVNAYFLSDNVYIEIGDPSEVPQAED